MNPVRFPAGAAALVFVAGWIASAAGSDEPEPRRLSIGEARLLALEHNAAFRVERLRPAIRSAAEAAERAAFDPELAASAVAGRTEAGGQSASRGRAEAGLAQTWPAGTRLEAGAAAARREDPARPDDPDFEGGLSVAVTQPLLRGRGPAAQGARLRQARIDTRISRHVLRGAAETLVSRVEGAAWDFVLAGRRIAIFEESLRLAEEQRQEVEERIRIGRLADIELAAAAAEVAQRREDLITARAVLARRRLELARLIGPGVAGWDEALRVTDEPGEPGEEPEPVGARVRRALEARADLLEARLLVERGEVEFARTRNGLLPRLDAFIAFGRTGYADSFSSAYGSPEREEESLEAGLRMSYALGARRERAAHERSRVERWIAEEALRNMEELVEFDVRAAHLEALRSRDQIAATRATRRFREEAFRAETEKLRVGRSTSLLVAQTQRDLVAARIAEIEAVVGHLKARLELDRLDGSILERRGIGMDF